MINKITNKIQKNSLIIFVFIIILILLGGMHSVIGMYFDDYGNASLSYSYVVPNVQGTNYTINDLFEWGKQIYLIWGGRVLYAIAFIIPLLKTGITNYMIVQVLVLFSIFFTSYKIIRSTQKVKYKFLIPTILFLLYTCLNMVYLRHGVYWASASILYVWPILPFLITIYLYNKINNLKEKKLKVNYYLYLPILLITITLTTLSQEQIGGALIVYFIMYILFKHIKKIKKFLLIDLYVLILSISSYLILFLAPGNFVRLDTNVEFSKLSALEKIIKNLPDIARSLFAKELVIYNILLFISLIFMCFSSIKIIKKVKIILLSIITLQIISIILFYNNNLIISMTTILFQIVTFIIMYMYFKKIKNIEYSFMYIASLASIFCLVFSPVVGGRTLIPYLFFLFIILTKVMIDIISHKNKYIKYASFIAIIIIGSYGIINYSMIYRGYSLNYATFSINHKKLLNYNRIDNTIILYKELNSYYGSTRPYEEPSMEYWIKEYYNIDHSVQFIWVDQLESN